MYRGINLPSSAEKLRGRFQELRPSGTENIYKIYAESFRDEAHLQRLLADAQSVVDAALAEA